MVGKWQSGHNKTVITGKTGLVLKNMSAYCNKRVIVCSILCNIFINNNIKQLTKTLSE